MESRAGVIVLRTTPDLSVHPEPLAAVVGLVPSTKQAWDEEDHGRSGGERPHPTKSNPTSSSRSRRCTPGARADLLAAEALAPGDARVARALRALG